MLELNGLVETMSHTIMERVQSMLAHAKLSKKFWVELQMTTVYMINKSLSVPLDGEIPQRVWISKDVSYQHLRVFDCVA